MNLYLCTFMHMHKQRLMCLVFFEHGLFNCVLRRACVLETKLQIYFKTTAYVCAAILLLELLLRSKRFSMTTIRLPKIVTTCLRCTSHNNLLKPFQSKSTLHLSHERRVVACGNMVFFFQCEKCEK